MYLSLAIRYVCVCVGEQIRVCVCYISKHDVIFLCQYLSVSALSLLWVETEVEGRSSTLWPCWLTAGHPATLSCQIQATGRPDRGPAQSCSHTTLTTSLLATENWSKWRISENEFDPLRWWGWSHCGWDIVCVWVEVLFHNAHHCPMVFPSTVPAGIQCKWTTIKYIKNIQVV